MDVHYGGYMAHVSPEAGGTGYVVQVRGLSDFASAIAATLHDVPFVFRKLVEDYFEACRQAGKLPETPTRSPSCG